MDLRHYRHPIFFYTASIGITWMVLLVTSCKEITNWSPNVEGIISLFVPLLVAVALIVPNASLRFDVATRLFKIRRINPKYLSFAFLLMPFTLLTAQVISLFLGGSTDQFQIREGLGLFSVGLFCILVPVAQELAWRSYGTDSLRNRFSLLNTSLLFTLFWTLWSLPLLSLVRGHDQSLLAESGVLYTVHFFVSPFPFFLIMNWLYYQTDRNIWITVLFHLSARYFNELYATTPTSRVIQTGLLTLLSIYLIKNNKQKFIKR